MKKAPTPEVLAVLASIEKEHGSLIPELVVEHARDPTSPLHEHFEWDPNKAHAEYLIIQARALIRIVKIQLTVEERTIRVPKYVKDPRQGQNAGYVTVTKVKKQGDIGREVMLMELRRALAMLKRAERVGLAINAGVNLTEPIAHVVGIIDKLDPSEDQAAE